MVSAVSLQLATSLRAVDEGAAWQLAISCPCCNATSVAMSGRNQAANLEPDAVSQGGCDLLGTEALLPTLPENSSWYAWQMDSVAQMPRAYPSSNSS